MSKNNNNLYPIYLTNIRPNILLNPNNNVQNSNTPNMPKTNYNNNKKIKIKVILNSM